MNNRQVVIDCFPESVGRYRDTHAIVAIDVIRATTMAVTASALGRRCFCAATIDEVRRVAARLDHPIIAGELAGDMPEGFDLNNSPAELCERTDGERPIVLLSSSGTKLVRNAAAGAHPTYLACFRNFSATAQHIAGLHPKVAVIGAGSRKEFREEDQMCCAWVAEQLMRQGYVPEDGPTLEVVQHWKGVPPAACTVSNSVAYLRRTDQMKDLDFILAHIDDLDMPFCIEEQYEVRMMRATKAAAALVPEFGLAA